MDIDREDVRQDQREQQQGGNAGGGTQLSGGPTDSDMGAGGGSSSGGGYRYAQNQENHQGQSDGLPGYGSNPDQSRGERFDEAQGGGRGAGSTGDDADEIARDQQEHQDRGQSWTEEEDSGR